MASVLVYIQTEGACASESSIEALGEARRIATTLGGTLYALVTVPGQGNEHEELIESLGRHGADRVALAQRADGNDPCLWSTRSTALLAAVDRVRPNLVVLAGNDPGRDIAPRLAAHLRAAYYADPSVQYGSHGEVVLSRTLYGATHRQRISAEDLDIPIVATLTPGSYKPSPGTDDAEVLFIEHGLQDSSFEHLESVPDPGADLDRARVIACAGAGCDDDATALVAKLADALGGKFGVTRGHQAKRDDASDRVIDVRGRSVSPALYVACGASGSMGHLGAVSPDSEILAVNSDPDADIFRVASYGIVGDVSKVLEGLLDELGKKSEDKRE